jgi:NADH-quinone oxidoreductase subunit N
MVAFDKYALFFTLLFCFAGVLTVMLSDAYLARRSMKRGEYYALMLFAITGMVGMAIANDVVALFVAFELMSLPTYVLAGARLGDRRSGEAALKYFVNGAFASAILLFGLAFLYGATGSTSYTLIGETLGALSVGDSVVVLALVMICTGFGFKVAAVPLHGWAPDVYEGAPTPITAFMSVAIKAGAFAGIVRLFDVALSPAWDAWSIVLIVLAVTTMVVGNALALPQRNVKRMLAYSSIAHAGYLLLGVIALGPEGTSAAASAVLFYLVAYAFMNLGAFGILILIRARRPFSYSLDEMAGLGRAMPLASFAMMLFMLSLTGVPPMAGFWGKFYLFAAVIDSGFTWLAIVAVLMSAVSAFYYLRIVWYMYFREPEGAPAELEPSGAGVGWAVALSTAGVVLLGLYPDPVIRAAQAALRAFVGG